MSLSITFAFGCSKKNITSSCFCALSFDHTKGKQAIKGFKKGQNIKQILETFIVPFPKDHYDKIELMFKSQRVAKSFQEQHYIPPEWKIKSLEGLQILKIENSKFDENAIHSILLESLSSENMDISDLTKTEREVLIDLVPNLEDALTQSLLVGIAKQPKAYDLSKCFVPLSADAKTYLTQMKKYN
jgi:hypothetical protein